MLRRATTQCPVLDILDAGRQSDLNHISGVRCTGRISEHSRLQIPCGQVVSSCEPKEIDYLVGVGTDDMSAENLTRSIFDQRFITVHPFREATGRIPIWRVVRPHFELQPFRLRLTFRQTHGGYWWDCESHTRHPAIIRLMEVAFQNVGRNDPTVVARYGVRAVMHCRVAGSGDQRIGYALEIFVQFEAAFADGTFRDFRFRAAARG